MWKKFDGFSLMLIYVMPIFDVIDICGAAILTNLSKKLIIIIIIHISLKILQDPDFDKILFSKSIFNENKYF